ncbi:hypothetical protein C8R44DRAFT_826822 [Mycena epipterygia]|nr:hypothetical protein C8R44DRAFT_826822 [Mycena epipterygia]
MSIISSLTLNQFHHTMCYLYLSTFSPRPVHDKIQLGAIVSLDGDSIQEVAYIPNASFRDSGWTGSSFDNAEITPTHMENGWSRWCTTNWECWLSQTNYVFSQLPTPPKHEDCFFIEDINYQLSFSSPSENLPDGYLFLCPLEDLRDDDGAWLANPECPAYWSLDPSGSQRLSTEEASSLEFPSLNWKTYVQGCSWDEGLYLALSRFHTAKGFDPNSQELARHLEQPLYHLSSSISDDSARFEEISSDPCGTNEPPSSSSSPPELIPTPATPSPEILVPNVSKKRARDEVDPSNIIDTCRIRKKPKRPDA